MPSERDRYEPTEYAGSPNLFRESDCQGCALFEECGGSSTAPCGCVWDDPEQRHDCMNCSLICRARTEAPSPYHKVVDDGRSLDEVSIDQRQLQGAGGEKNQVLFPILIPYQTRDLPEGTRLPMEWAAVRLPELISKGGDRGTPSRLLASENIREELRVGPQTKILPVLNAKDDCLAALWEMDRSELYSHAERHGVEAITGPTFSIYSEREGDPRRPAAMNVIMQKRHHQVLAEIGARTTAAPIPNLYWRDQRDRQKWAEWLEENQIRVVSRDFTMTTQPETFRPEFAGLLEILGHVSRSIHVLVVGVGMTKAGWTIRRLAEEGHTCSIVMSDPIHTGAAKGRRVVREKGGVKKKESDIPLRKLGMENLEAAERALLATAQDTPLYSDLLARCNVTHRRTRDPSEMRKESSAARGRDFPEGRGPVTMGKEAAPTDEKTSNERASK